MLKKKLKNLFGQQKPVEASLLSPSNPDMEEEIKRKLQNYKPEENKSSDYSPPR